MPVLPYTLQKPLPVPGFKVGSASCGVKSADLKGKRQDVTLIVADVPAQAAAVFTQNAFRAACVDLGEQTVREHATNIRAIVANAGNANAGVGEMERVWSQQLIDLGAEVAEVSSYQVLSASTGVIGEPFPIERIRDAIDEAGSSLAEDNWLQAAEAIRTTDTFAKYTSRQFETNGKTYTITGVSKGSGMIHPNMATMLGFMATDAPIRAEVLQDILSRVTDESFNSISVDGDTSTNDTVYLLSSGLGLGDTELQDITVFEKALSEVAIELAQLIVRDGEGVTKFVTIEVSGAENETQARELGRTIAVSPLVKTAFAGSDANWGRIIMAIGNSGSYIQSDKVSIKADDVLILKDGNLHPDYRDDMGMAVFAKQEFTLSVDIGLGDASAKVWTGDLTHEYITINAEYRS
ncbi:bifunctional glutamate N-acetyltransferase/amino-acid acetyltransferase ArgJ [Ghiorsea bivora]|uniref:bifunctional glutamate N-acetyltransferase/amino-acid acetyltransferase ArgJ n=1 Tax=Ghiorsea bivora TaxID=1485545 RepID=UPI00056EF19D|nr:bifunctional glutamate N-acetyltransferase/amino-acid acetyltransferase ArgJ [Ghiorsea bivora]